MMISFAPVVLSLVPLAPVQSPTPARELGSHEKNIVHMVLSPKRDVLYTSTADGAFHAWELKSGELLWVNDGGMPMPPKALAVGEELLVHHNGIAAVSMLDTKTGDAHQGQGGTTAMLGSKCVAVDPKDRWVWLGTDKGGITRITPGDIKGWSNRKLGNGIVHCFAMDPKGKTLAVGNEDGTVRFVGAKSANVEDKKKLEDPGHPVLSIAVDPKVAHVITGSKKGRLLVWKSAGKRVKFELEGHKSDLRELAVDSKGKRFASADRKGRVIVWDLAKGTALLTLELDAAVNGLAFVAKDGLLATTTATGTTIQLWDLSEL